MRIAKIVLAAVAAIVVLLIVAVVIVASTFDPNDYKGVAANAFTARTGRTLTVDENLRLTYFPWLALETGAAMTLLGGIGLVAIGLSGLLAAAMGALFGRDFVGGGLARSVFGGPPASVAENAGDAVSLRVLAGLVGVVLLAGVWAARRAGLRLRVLPVSYVDLVALVAFAGATVVLGAGSVDQLVQHAGRGIGFFLSGALASLAGAVLFGIRSVRSVLPRA